MLSKALFHSVRRWEFLQHDTLTPQELMQYLLEYVLDRWQENWDGSEVGRTT